jgi:hypothetical protein
VKRILALILLAAAAGAKSPKPKASPKPAASPTPEASPTPTPSPTPAPPPPPPAKITAPAKSSPAPEPALALLPEKASNGAPVLATVTGLQDGDAVTLTFAGEWIPCHADEGRAECLIGIDLDMETGKSFSVIARVKRDGKTTQKKQSIALEDSKYEVQTLTLPPEKVNPSDENLKRIERENKELAALWHVVTPDRFWHGDFHQPVSGIVLEKFGGRRVINGQARAPHSALDQRAPEGTPIYAINAGKVIFEEEQFFGGNVTVIDHGQGVYSMYMHQSKQVVKVGDMVETGQKIGEAGATGRATGPHLHWGVRVDGARVDPTKLLALDLTSTEIPGRAWAGTSGAMTMGASTAGTPAMTSGTSGNP